MKAPVPLVLALLLGAAAQTQASDDCSRPMADWQPREAVGSHLAQLGITLQRVRIDDGCYEVRGRDRDGNAVELKLDPATLGLKELEVRFRDGADPTRYLPGARRHTRSSTPADARTAADRRGKSRTAPIDG